MRILLTADVHANWEALLGLQRAEAQPDGLLFAGDAVGYGADPEACARWLCAHAAAAVRGNHDAALADPAADGFPPELAEAARESLACARRSLSAESAAALERWPLTAWAEFGGARFLLVHGTPADPLAGQLDPATCRQAELERLFGGLPADVIVLGHTHLPALRRLGNTLIVNPGSLGQPRWGRPEATYAAWQDGNVQIHHLSYGASAPARKLALLGLSPESAGQLAGVLETGLV